MHSEPRRAGQGQGLLPGGENGSRASWSQAFTRPRAIERPRDPRDVVHCPVLG